MGWDCDLASWCGARMSYEIYIYEVDCYDFLANFE